MAESDAEPATGWLAALCVAASQRYRPAGRFARHFARGKLHRDAVFGTLLQRGLIADGTRIVDLGCGQGLLAAWLFAARAAWDRHDWPAAWPTPPRVTSFYGIDRSRADIARAHAALGKAARFTCGDLRDATPLLVCDVVVLLDVLHYLDAAAQDAVLGRVRDALAPDGLLILRVGDAASQLRSRLANLVDLTVCALRGNPLPRLHRRPLLAWHVKLSELGFVVDVVPMLGARLEGPQRMPYSSRHPSRFANVLLAARLKAATTVGQQAALR